MSNFIGDFFEKKKAEDDDFKRRNPNHLPTKMQTICRMIVGGYLLYLDYKMWTEGALKESKGTEYILFIAAMILFLVAGVFFLVKGFLTYRKGEFFDPNKDDFSEEGQAEAEAKRIEEEAREAEEIAANGGVKPGSLASFAHLTEASTVSEEDQDEAYEAAKQANEEE